MNLHPAQSSRPCWRWGRNTSALVVLAFMAGCSTTNVATRASQRITTPIGSVDIHTDVLILEDIKGAKPFVDVPRCQYLAAELNDHLSAAFAHAGIEVGQCEVAAIGLRYATLPTPAVPTKLAPGAEPVERNAPFWIAETYQTPSLRGLLQNALEDLQRLPAPGPPSTTAVSASSRALPASATCTHQLLVLCEAAEVSSGKSAAQAIATTLVSLGNVTSAQATQLRFRIGLIDAMTGQFVAVSDLGRPGGGILTAAELKSLADRFISRIPDRPKPPASETSP